MSKQSLGLAGLFLVYANATVVAASPDLIDAARKQLAPGVFPAEQDALRPREMLQSLSAPQDAPADIPEGATLRVLLQQELSNLPLTSAGFGLRPADLDLLNPAKSLLLDSNIPTSDLREPAALERSLVEQLLSSPTSNLTFEPDAVAPSKLAPDKETLEAAERLLLPDVTNRRETK